MKIELLKKLFTTTIQDSKDLYPNKLKELFSIDLRSLALFRICMACLLIADLIILGSDLKAFYTDWGFLPRSVLLDSNNSPWYISINLINGGAFLQTILFVIAFIFAFFLLIGYKTRFSTFMSWFFLLSLHFRNTSILSCADGYLRSLFFWSMFIPLGACCSIDKIFSPKKEILPKQIFSMGTCAVLLQIIFLYLFSAHYKSAAFWHIDATAAYYALSLEELATPLGTYLLHFPDFLKLSTRIVYWLELLGPFLLLMPVCTGPIRTIAVLSFIFMHTAFGTCLALGVFSWICCFAVLLFLPTWFWETIFIYFKNLTFVSSIKNWFHKTIITFLETNSVIAYKPLRIHYSLFENLFIAFCLMYVFMWNAKSIRPECIFPDYLRPFGQMLQLEEEWNMFAPYPSPDDGWYIIPGKLMDGTEVDLFRNGQPVKWKKPKLISNSYKNHYWFKLYENLRQGDNTPQLLNFGRYLCRKWDATHKDDREIQKFSIYFMRETTLPDYKSPKPEKVLLWDHWCVDVPSSENASNQ